MVCTWTNLPVRYTNALFFNVLIKFQFISYMSRHCEKRVMSVIYIYYLSCIRSAILYISSFYQKSEYEGGRSYKKKI